MSLSSYSESNDSLLGRLLEPPLPELSPAKRSLIAGLHTALDCNGTLFLFGRNEHSLALAKTLPVTAIVDDFYPDSQWEGIPVVRGELVPLDAILVNCVLSIRNNLASRRIAELGIRNVLSYGELLQGLPDKVPAPWFMADARTDVREHLEEWKALREALADDESRQVFDDVLGFRLSCGLEWLKNYTFRPKDQYFESFLDLRAGEVFVDCGGFDGDTTEEFSRRCPAYEAVHFFEPSGINLEKAKQRLNDQRDINYVQQIASDAPGVMYFDADSGSASSVSSTGSIQVQATTIDERVQSPVSFVKMDIEGWELNALKGCRRHILEDHPKLAIAVYHRAADFRTIPHYILGLRPDYRVFLRHYTEGWSETVMYFVPA